MTEAGPKGGGARLGAQHGFATCPGGCGIIGS